MNSLKEDKVHQNYMFYSVVLFSVFIVVTLYINYRFGEVFMISKDVSMAQAQVMLNEFLNKDYNLYMIIAYGIFSMFFLIKLTKATIKEHKFLNQNKIIKNKHIHTFFAMFLLCFITPLYIIYPLYFNKLLSKVNVEKKINLAEDNNSFINVKEIKNETNN